MMETQSETTMAELIRYNNWANQQVLEACQALSEEQLATAIPGAFGTIRETLEHIFRAEAGYARLLTGKRPEPPFDWADRPGVADLRAYAVQVGEALMEAANRVSPAAPVSEEWEGKQVSYQAIVVFIQIINHGVEHRTNITTVLNQGMQTPPDVDGWGYLMAHLDRFELE